MLQDTRMALFLLAELFAALRANDPELLLDWLDPFITRVERDRTVAWHLGVSH